MERLKQQVRRAEKAVRGLREVLLEIWLDGVGGNRKQDTGYREGVRELGNRRMPIIAVCRGPIERGNFNGSEKERVKRLENAVADGAKFVDVGIHTNPSLIKNLKKICLKKRAKLIISKHFYASTPDLKIFLKTCRRAKQLGADIVKIATFVKNWSDNALLFEFTKRLAAKGEQVIVVGMGKKGKISRIGCPLLGSYLTYAALDKKSRTASGQPIIATLDPNP